MSSYILFAHVWVHAALEDVALRVITSAEWAACVPAMGCPGMYGIHSCTRAGAGAGAVPHPVRAPPHRLFAGCG